MATGNWRKPRETKHLGRAAGGARSRRTAPARRAMHATSRGGGTRAKDLPRRRGPTRRPSGQPDDAAVALGPWFPALRARAGAFRGLGALVAVVEGDGSSWDVATVINDQTEVVSEKDGGKPGMGRGRGRSRAAGTGVGVGPEEAVGRAAKVFGSKSSRSELAALLAALASEHRLRILSKLLEGAATYRSLQRVTGLKAGPLYHHIANLRLASLVAPKQRDLYELTRAGRNVLLAALVLGPLAKDRRRRPPPRK
jgi:DNA-binding transcriptional ArsR family regulator